MVISVQFKPSASAGPTTITLKENTNPKLYASIKEAIDKHMSSASIWQQPNVPRGGLFVNYYGVILFSYDPADNNTITGVGFVYTCIQ